LRWTMEGPLSSYSCFEIHICWKVDRDAKIDPPIQTAVIKLAHQGPSIARGFFKLTVFPLGGGDDLDLH
jgi:hypothetical protein